MDTDKIIKNMNMNRDKEIIQRCKSGEPCSDFFDGYTKAIDDLIIIFKQETTTVPDIQKIDEDANITNLGRLIDVINNRV